MNGCGPDKGIINPPHHIFFEASCNKHDRLYDEGGKEIDRLIADKLFLFYMKQDIKRQALLTRPYYYLWAHLYYLAVRIGGSKHFNYK